MSTDIRLDSYYLGDANACWIMGRVGPERQIGPAKSLLEKMWGKNRPTLLIPPGPELNSYPRVCLAWITGPAKEVGDDGTHLFVIWFVNEDPIHPLQDAMALVDKHGGWDALAKGFGI